MFWSLKETNRLRIARRIVGGFNILFGSILVMGQIAAFLFNCFSPPSLHELAIGICLVISGFGLLLWRPRASGV